MKTPVRRVGPTTLTQRAEASLATTEHSVFNPKHAEVRLQSGIPLPPKWSGPLVARATVHEPTTVTRSWRVQLWPQKWYAFLPAELTRDEALQAAEVLRELTNLRRNGA